MGEVFTTPVLEGTEGLLHVKGVYLEGLFFKDLEIRFENGRVAGYNCSNFESEEENNKQITGTKEYTIYGRQEVDYPEV